jgi:CPA1 family monovalent cation:H+ antiporter
VAATSATKGLSIPKKLITVLEGESLVNDATGLIAYRYAIAAVASGTFIFWLAAVNFIYVAGFGIALGIATGFIFYWVHRITPDNATTDTAFTLLAPYTSYLVAEYFHTSGVLSVVTCGLILSWTSSEVFNHQTRIQANAVWNTMIFLLNGLIFILIGLELPRITANLQGGSFWTLISYGALISAATILLRIIWVYPSAYLLRWLFKSVRKKEPDMTPKMLTIVAWSGMRGIVSLATALALPLTIRTSDPFPNRDLIIFITFCVIFSTLVVQGLTLRPLVRWLGVKAVHGDEEKTARVRLAYAAIEHIEENFALSLSDEVLSQIKKKYEMRIQRIMGDNEQSALTPEQIEEFWRVQHQLVKLERKLIIDMRNAGKLDDEILRRVEYELDLEETRLRLEHGHQ